MLNNRVKLSRLTSASKLRLPLAAGKRSKRFVVRSYRLYFPCTTIVMSSFVAMS